MLHKKWSPRAQKLAKVQVPTRTVQYRTRVSKGQPCIQKANLRCEVQVRTTTTRSKYKVGPPFLGTRAPRRWSHVYNPWPTLNHSAWSTDHLTFSLFDPQTQWTPLISHYTSQNCRTHCTRVFPYSRDFESPAGPHFLSRVTFFCWVDKQDPL